MGRVRFAGGDFCTITSMSRSRTNAAGTAITVCTRSRSKWGSPLHSNPLKSSIDPEEDMVSQAIDFEKLIRAAGDAMIAAGPDGRIILWNPAAERMFGFS